MKLVSLSCAFICGIFLGSLITLPVHIVASLLAILLLLSLLAHNTRLCLGVSLCFAAALGGLLVYHYGVSEPTLHLYNDQGEVQVQGSLERDSEYDGTMTSFCLNARRIHVGDEGHDVSGAVLVYFRGYSPYSAGDEVTVTGVLQTPVASPDKAVSARGKGDLQSAMFNPSIELTGRGWLSGLRNRLSDSLGSALPEPQSSLAQALLLGIRSHVPESLDQDFRDSGTAHIMAISGLNVAILGGMVLGAAAWVLGRQRPTYILVCLGAIWLYAVLTGMQPPVFRAAIMFSLFLAALWVGRPYSALPAIALAAAVIVGTDPEALWEVSFQLSFAAVVGIVALSSPIMRLCKGVARRVVSDEGWGASVIRPILTSVAVSFAAMMATLPLIAYYFGSVSAVSVPATLVLLPALPGALVMASLAGAVGLFMPPLAQVMGWVAWVFLAYITEVVDASGSLPFASWQVSGIEGGWVWGYYGVILGLLWVIPSRRRLGRKLSGLSGMPQRVLDRFGGFFDKAPKKWLATGLAVLAILVWTAVLAAPDRRLQVNFLDVGQGDSILIVTPAGQQILVDGGPDPDKVCLELGERLPFWDRSLDLIVLTHPDDDHLVGLLEVLKRYDVKQVLEPGLEVESTAYDKWLALTEEKRIKRTIARSGQEMYLGDGVSLAVLHPLAELLDSEGSDTNNSSVVLHLTWNDVSFLLTGDIEAEVEQEILHCGGGARSTVLKVAHHGSRDSTSEEFLTAVQPHVAVVSAGADNSFGHPHEEVIARLEEKVGSEGIYVTSEDGTVTVTTDGQRMWVDTEKG